MNDRIKELQQQIELEQNRIRSCKHQFGTPYFDTETVIEEYGYKIVGQGSDVWGEPEGYRQVEKPRWARECSECGLIEFTYNTKPIIISNEPLF